MQRLYLFFCVLFLFLFLFQLNPVSAQSLDQPIYLTTSNVSGSVGNYYLNISGVIAPYASIVLTSQSTFLRSTVADNIGYFSISQILINRGFNQFCLDAIDIERLGESYTCFIIPPAISDITMNNLFLPPTVGLQRDEVEVGNTLLVWGYSLPDDLVHIHLSDGKVYTTMTSSLGYYSMKVPLMSEGKYELFADAELRGVKSSVPVKKISYTVLSKPQEAIKKMHEQIINLGKKITNAPPLGILWLAIPILILIIILLQRLFTYWKKGNNPQKFRFIFIPDQKLLHHAWFVGY